MIPLATPDLRGREGAYLEECVRTNFVSSAGPFVVRLEEMTAAATGARRGVATSSGTAALELALRVVGVGRDDLVIMPSFTFVATANAASHCGATPWFVDIEPDSLNLDPDALATVLAEETHRRKGTLVHRMTGRRVAAVVPVYAFGLPAAMDRIRGVARRYGLPLVADAAAAIGARCGGRPLAQAADVSILSFNGNKTVTAGGGGMLVGDDLDRLELAHHLSTTARTGTNYEYDRVGFNYRMTNLQAAVGCAQMERLDELVAKKRQSGDTYDRGLDRLEGAHPLPGPHGACWLSGAMLDPDGPFPSVSALVAQLRTRGVQAGPAWKPLHLQIPYLDAPRGSLAVAEALWDRIVLLPCSTHLSAEDQATVLRELAAARRLPIAAGAERAAR